MTPGNSNEITADREEPVGAPVVRGDPEITGAHADQAARFDPDDPESLAEAAAVVREFATRTPGDGASRPDLDGNAGIDTLSMLRGAAACAALVRGEGSYSAAAERSGVSVPFLRKWARVHDLPISIRRHIAGGDIAPTAAMHVARVTGDARFLLAWAVIDEDLPVGAVREAASLVNDGVQVERALAEIGVVPGQLTIRLPMDVYRELRRRASLDARSPDDLVAEALVAWFDHG